MISISREFNSAEYQRFRLWAMLIEGIPLIIIFLGAISNFPQLTSIGMMLMLASYFFMGWYIFRAKRYTFWNITFGTLFGAIMGVILTGMCFYFNEWNGWKEMMAISNLTLWYGFYLILFYGLIVHFKKERRPFQFTMSQKMLLRVVMLMVLFYATDMHIPFSNIMHQGTP